MIYAHTLITINKHVSKVFSLICIVACSVFTGCSAPTDLDKSTKEQMLTPTAVPDQGYQYTFRVTEINGQYYEFPDYDKYRVITAADERGKGVWVSR